MEGYQPKDGPGSSRPDRPPVSIRKGGVNSEPSQVVARPPAPGSVSMPRSVTFSSPFDIKDRVIVDGDPSLVATVIGIAFTRKGTDVRVAWLVNGQMNDGWIDDWRLTLAERG